MNDSHYYFYVLKWEETFPDEWEEVVATKSKTTDTFKSAFGQAVEMLLSLENGIDCYVAHIGRRDYDPEWLDYVVPDDLEEMAVEINHRTGIVSVCNAGQNLVKI